MLEYESAKNALPRTMRDLIYENLKSAIINGKLRANQRINEKELTEHFRVSRTPVREAVLRLAAEGFVQIDSYRRAVVKMISYKELSEIYEVLGALDRLAIGQAVDNLSIKEIRKLEQIINKMEKYCNINSIEKYLELNVKFHDEIWKAVHNKLLVETLHSVRDKLLRYNYSQIYAFKQPGALQKSIKEHKELLEAIIAKDKENLKNLIEKHRGSLGTSSVYDDGIKEYFREEKV